MTSRNVISGRPKLYRVLDIRRSQRHGPATVIADDAHHVTELMHSLGRRAKDDARSQETDRLREHHTLFEGKGVKRMRRLHRAFSPARQAEGRVLLHFFHSIFTPAPVESGFLFFREIE